MRRVIAEMANAVPSVPAESQRIIDRAVEILGDEQRWIVLMLYGLGSVDATCRMVQLWATHHRALPAANDGA